MHHVGWVHFDDEDEAMGVHVQMPLPALDLFGATPVGLTLWLSMIPALGWACRPRATRSCLCNRA
jgi:hypothetical protein